MCGRVALNFVLDDVFCFSKGDDATSQHWHHTVSTLQAELSIEHTTARRCASEGGRRLVGVRDSRGQLVGILSIACILFACTILSARNEMTEQAVSDFLGRVATLKR